MVAQQVLALLLHVLEEQLAVGHDQPAPEIAQLRLRAADAELDLLDDGAGLLERLDRLRDHALDPRVDREDVEIRAVGDPPALDVAAERRAWLDRLVQAERVARVVAGQHAERDGGILDGPADRPLIEERRRAAEGIGPGHERDASGGRLVAIDAAPRRRDPDRAAAIGALGQRQQAIGDRTGTAARRAAGIAGDVEGIAAGPEQVVVADAAKAQDRAVGLAEDDGAGLLDPLGEHAVDVVDLVGERPDSAEGADEAWLEVEQILDRGRHAMQRPQRLARDDRLLGRLGCPARLVEGEVDQGRDARIARLDPRDHRIHHLDRRQLARPDLLGEPGSAAVGKLVG